jgi:hypothetical protein
VPASKVLEYNWSIFRDGMKKLSKHLIVFHDILIKKCVQKAQNWSALWPNIEFLGYLNLVGSFIHKNYILLF